MLMSKLIINNFSKKIKDLFEEILLFSDNANLFYGQSYVNFISSSLYKIDFDIHSKKTNEILFTYTIKFTFEGRSAYVSSRITSNNTFKNKDIYKIDDIVNFQKEKITQDKILEILYKDVDTKVKETRINSKYNTL